VAGGTGLGEQRLGVLVDEKRQRPWEKRFIPEISPTRTVLELTLLPKGRTLDTEITNHRYQVPKTRRPPALPPLEPWCQNAHEQVGKHI
jgi:flavin-dependent dehydrogenase